MYKRQVDDFVIFNKGKGLKRISLTPKVLSASSKIVFLVSGASKKQALKRLIDEKEPADRTPSKLIKSNNLSRAILLEAPLTKNNIFEELKGPLELMKFFLILYLH